MYLDLVKGEYINEEAAKNNQCIQQSPGYRFLRLNEYLDKIPVIYDPLEQTFVSSVDRNDYPCLRFFGEGVIGVFSRPGLVQYLETEETPQQLRTQKEITRYFGINGQIDKELTLVFYVNNVGDMVPIARRIMCPREYATWKFAPTLIKAGIFDWFKKGFLFHKDDGQIVRYDYTDLDTLADILLTLTKPHKILLRKTAEGIETLWNSTKYYTDIDGVQFREPVTLNRMEAAEFEAEVLKC